MNRIKTQTDIILVWRYRSTIDVEGIWEALSLWVEKLHLADEMKKKANKSK